MRLTICMLFSLSTLAACPSRVPSTADTLSLLSSGPASSDAEASQTSEADQTGEDQRAIECLTIRL